jgi:ATP-dependent exoDNAse (exonuclease V) beta subunit
MDQKSGSILWCHPQKAPFNKLHIVPVNYSKQLNKTLFAEDYYHEKLHAYIDNLNTLYVAFTRAKEELIVFTPNAEVKHRKEVSQLIGETLQLSDRQSTNAESLLPKTCQPVMSSSGAGGELDTSVRDKALAITDPSTSVGMTSKQASVTLLDGLHSEEGFFEWGDRWYPAPFACVATGEIPMPPLPSILPDERIFLRLHRNGNYFDDAKRKHGILMHDILSHIQTATDTRKAIMDKEMAGEINSRESAELTVQLEQLLDLPEVKKWFDGSMQVMNEMEILHGNGKSYRPDRIMIDRDQAIVVDYKFGESENSHDQQQVKKYISLIQKLGYMHVTGYLWYIELNKIVPVSRED